MHVENSNCAFDIVGKVLGLKSYFHNHMLGLGILITALFICLWLSKKKRKNKREKKVMIQKRTFVVIHLCQYLSALVL